MKILFYLPLLAITIAGSAQNKIYPFSDGKKWGLANSKAEAILPVQFDTAFDFTYEGYALVKKNKKAGLIDVAGTTIVPFIYDDIQPVYTGMVKGKINNKFVLLDFKTGKKLLPATFDQVHKHCQCPLNLLAVTQAGKQGFLNIRTGKPVGKIIYDDVDFFHEFDSRGIITVGKKMGLMNLATGVVIIQPKYERINTRYKKGREYITADATGEATRYFDENGIEINIDAPPPPKKGEDAPIEEVGIETMAEAAVAADDNFNKNMYVYDQGNGNWKVTIEKRGYSTTEVVETHTLSGYENLKTLVYFPYGNKPQLKIKAIKNGKTGIIDMSGNIVTPFNYDNIEYHGGYYITTSGDKTGVLNMELREIKKPVLKKIYKEDYGRDAYFIEMPGGQLGYMDKNSGRIFIPGVTE